MDEEDDFYGGGGGGGADSTAQDTADKPAETSKGADDMEVEVQANDEEADEESEDEVQFTLEKPEGTKTDDAKKSNTAPRTQAVTDEKKSTKISTPTRQDQRSSVVPVTNKESLKHNGKQGKDFPEVRSSKIDINGAPIWPGVGKPITEIDIDADLAENTKPWRLPGTDQTDFFNYGFDEYTWAQYCIRQQSMANTINEQRQADAQMKAMFGAGGPGGQGAGMGQMPMPPPEMMQQAMQSGMTQEDFFQMWMSGGIPGMNGPQGPQGPQGGGGFGHQGNFGGGPGLQGASPRPQGGQGFQPPTGPAAQTQQGDQGGFGNVEGYSPQQLAILQQQHGGGRGRGRGRGRGFF